MPLPNVNLPMNSHVTVTASPKDANGNPGTTQADMQPPSWTAPAGVSVQAAADGLSAVVASAMEPGVFQVDVSFQPVAFGPNITSSFTVTVAEQPATQLVFSFGPVQPN